MNARRLQLMSNGTRDVIFVCHECGDIMGFTDLKLDDHGRIPGEAWAEAEELHADECGERDEEDVVCMWCLEDHHLDLPCEPTR